MQKKMYWGDVSNLFHQRRKPSDWKLGNFQSRTWSLPVQRHDRLKEITEEWRAIELNFVGERCWVFWERTVSERSRYRCTLGLWKQTLHTYSLATRRFLRPFHFSHTKDQNVFVPLGNILVVLWLCFLRIAASTLTMRDSFCPLHFAFCVFDPFDPFCFIMALDCLCCIFFIHCQLFDERLHCVFLWESSSLWLSFVLWGTFVLLFFRFSAWSFLVKPWLRPLQWNLATLVSNHCENTVYCFGIDQNLPKPQGKKSTSSK